MFQYSSFVKKPLDQCEIATHGRTFQIQHKSSLEKIAGAGVLGTGETLIATAACQGDQDLL